MGDPKSLSRQAAARYAPASGIFAPTTGLDPRLFESGALRPEVTEAIMERLDRCIRVDVQLAGSDWQEWMRVYLAGGSASEWAGNRPNEQTQDLDVLVGIDLKKAQGYNSFEGMDEQQAATALNAAFRHAFNETAAVLPGVEGTWDLTAYCNPGGYDIRDIKPYAAWDLSDNRWAVKPPHLPGHSLADFDPAVLAHARAVLAEARAILRMPEPLRSREAKDLWEHIHAHRCTAFGPGGTGWQDVGNVDEKWLAYAPGNVLGKIRELALPPKTAAAGEPRMMPLEDLHGVASMNYPGFTLDQAWRHRHPESRASWDIDNRDSPGLADIAENQASLRGYAEHNQEIPGHLILCSHGKVLEDGEHRYMAARDAGLDEVPVKRASSCLMPELHQYAEEQQKTAALEGPVDDEGYPKYYYHVSPHRLPMGTQLRPGVHMRGNFDESTGTHVHMTDDIDRAEQYRYLLWEQGHPEQHMYEVRPHGPVEPDPADSQAVRTHHPVTVEGTMDPEVDESDWFHPKTASREDQLAAMDPRTRASALAQEHTRMMNPRTAFPLDADQHLRPNKTMIRWLQQAGVPRAEESYVARHQDPSKGTSNTGRGPDGEPMVALHPDRWDYGTMAHETAHIVADHETGRPLGGPHGSHGPHDDRWAGHYAGFLNDISPGAGDEFLEQRAGHLGLSAEAAMDDDGDYYVTCDRGHEHWGAHGAAGLLIRHRGDDGGYRYLLQKRSDNGMVDHPGTWSIPGGAIRRSESPEDGARREATEELGTLPAGITHHHTFTDDHGGWAYHTVVMDAPQRFSPRGEDDDEDIGEVERHGWFTPARVKNLPLHPGFASSWDRVRKSGAVEKPTKTKDQVNYRKGTAAEHCGNCVMISLLPPDFESAHCTLVKGLIDPEDVCDEWSPAEGATKTASSLEPAADAPTGVAGPWYHGSGKRYREGDIIDPAVPHRRIHPQSDPGKAYFSDSAWNAQNWANVASPSGKGHVYEVEPTGDYEEDPHYSGPEERGIYDLSVSPIKRINVYQTGQPLRVVRRLGNQREAASGYDGLTDRSAMIYLEIPEGLVQGVQGGVDDHHITLVYLGKNVNDTDWAKAVLRAQIAAQKTPPLSGVLHGVDTFDPSDSSDNKVPAFVPAYIPGIGKLRQLLEDLSASEHRHYKPHVTLGYYEPDEDLPAPHPPVKVRFSRLHVKRGDQVVSFALGSPD